MIVKYEKDVNSVFRGDTRIKKIYRGIFGVFGINPFTPETYKILKENFPTKIAEIIEYANLHLQIVPFINEDPMLVCSLGIEGMPIRWLVGDGTAYINLGKKCVTFPLTSEIKFQVNKHTIDYCSVCCNRTGNKRLQLAGIWEDKVFLSWGESYGYVHSSYQLNFPYVQKKRVY